MNTKAIVVLVMAMTLIVNESQALGTGVLNGKTGGKRESGVLEKLAKVGVIGTSRGFLK